MKKKKDFDLYKLLSDRFKFIDKGIYQFGIRSLIFFSIVFGVYMFIFVYFRHTTFFLNFLSIPEAFYFEFLSGLRKRDFINAVMFTAIIFIIWNRDSILKIKQYSQVWSRTIIYGALSAIILVSHYIFKYWIRMNQDFALQNTVLISLSKYLFNIGFIVLLALAIFNTRFFKDQLAKYRMQIPIFLGIMVAYFFVIQVFQMIWRFFGNIAAQSVHFLLSIGFDNTYLNMNPTRNPLLGVGDFIVGISNECSGIDSLLLFISLYTVLLVLDWNRMDRKKMFILFIPGIIGTVLYNVLRIYMLILVGVFISPEFAIDMFHSNIGWILFLLFFMAFWHFGSSWVYIKNAKTLKNPKTKHK